MCVGGWCLVEDILTEALDLPAERAADSDAVSDYFISPRGVIRFYCQRPLLYCVLHSEKRFNEIL